MVTSSIALEDKHGALRPQAWVHLQLGLAQQKIPVEETGGQASYVS